MDQNGLKVPFHLVANDGNIMEHAVALDTLPEQGIPPCCQKREGLVLEAEAPGPVVPASEPGPVSSEPGLALPPASSSGLCVGLALALF